MTVFEKWNSPEEAGVSSAKLLEFIKKSEKLKGSVQFHGMILLRHGKEVFRLNWEPFDCVSPHMLFSLSKSFTSAAAGFAVSEGLISWDSSVTDILPEEIPEGREEELKGITLKALLCMGSGLEESSDSPSHDPKITWARHVLSHAVKHAPMAHFHYNSFGTYLVSCMVQKVTGQPLTEYLYPRLFAPLGIEKPEWDTSPEGICCGGFGLHLSTDSIARFGQCLLQKGMWQGRRVLPEGWTELATSEQIANYDGERQEGNEWAQGYGMQFWRCIDGRFRGDGAFGQACFVDEARDAVLAVTCATVDMGAEFRLIRECIFGAIDAEPAKPAVRKSFAGKSKALSHSWGLKDDGSEKELPVGSFSSETDEMKFRFSFSQFTKDIIKLNICFGDDPKQRLEVFLPRERMAFAVANPFQNNRYFGCYAWQKGKLRVLIRSIDGPDTADGCFTWTQNTLTFKGLNLDVFSINCRIGEQKWTKNK